MLQNSTRLGNLSVIIKGVPTTLSLNCQKAGATLVSCTNGWWFFYVCAGLEGVHRYNVIVVAFYLAIVLILILPCLWIEGDDGCVK